MKLSPIRLTNVGHVPRLRDMTKRLALAAATLIVAAIPTAAYAATLEPSGRNLKPCANEGSRGPCVWDAVHMGNGEGQSFIVLPPTSQQPDGRVVNVSHREAHELLNWS